MIKRGLISLGLLATCAPMGCATLWTLSSDRVEHALCHTPGAPHAFPRVFSGIHSDLLCLGRITAGPSDGLLAVMCLIDAPLSLAGDTIVLPFTIYRQIGFGSFHPRLVPEMDEEIYGMAGAPPAVASSCANGAVLSPEGKAIPNEEQRIP